MPRPVHSVTLTPEDIRTLDAAHAAICTEIDFVRVYIVPNMTPELRDSFRLMREQLDVINDLLLKLKRVSTAGWGSCGPLDHRDASVVDRQFSAAFELSADSDGDELAADLLTQDLPIGGES